MDLSRESAAFRLMPLDFDVAARFFGTAEFRATVWTIINSHSTAASAFGDHDDPRILTLPPLVSNIKLTRKDVLPKDVAAGREGSGYTSCAFLALGTIGMKFGHQSSRPLSRFFFDTSYHNPISASYDR